MSAADRLAKQLEEAEQKISELEEKIEASEYEEEWRWRHLFNLTPDENLDLPVPRLELRYAPMGKYNWEVKYGLVHERLMSEIEFVPFGSTKIGGSSRDDQERLELPFRSGADIYNDMYLLKIPGYVVNGKKFKQLDLTDRDALPNGLVAKMDGKPWR